MAYLWFILSRSQTVGLYRLRAKSTALQQGCHHAAARTVLLLRTHQGFVPLRFPINRPVFGTKCEYCLFKGFLPYLREISGKNRTILVIYAINNQFSKKYVDRGFVPCLGIPPFQRLVNLGRFGNLGFGGSLPFLSKRRFVPEKISKNIILRY